MASILLSGPAGAAKSALARRLLADHPTLAAIADFQLVYRALTDVTKDRDGRYPLRDERLLPLTEFTRRAIITGAVNADIDVIATNSDGDLKRRAFLLSQIGPGAVERVVDPGKNIVAARLSDPETGELSDECDSAIMRWYGRDMTMDEIRCELEFRADESRQSPGRITGVLLTYEQRARDRAELFTAGALEWDPDGIVLNEQHNRAAPIMRFIPELRGAELVIDAPLPDTSRGRDAAVMVRNKTLRGLSVEFRSLIESRQSGIRHIQKARLGGAGLVDSGSYGNRVEVRSKGGVIVPGGVIGWL